MMKKGVAANIKTNYKNEDSKVPDHRVSGKHHNRPSSPSVDLKMRYKLAEELSVGNSCLRNAAQSYIDQKKITDILKNDVHRIKRFEVLKSTRSKAQESFDDAQKKLKECSQRFASAYELLQKTLVLGQPIKYRKEYKTAAKSLAEFSKLAIEVIGSPRTPNSTQQQKSVTVVKQTHESRKAKDKMNLNVPKQISEGPGKAETADTSDDEDDNEEGEEEETSEEEDSEGFIGNELDAVDEEKENHEIHT